MKINFRSMFRCQENEVYVNVTPSLPYFTNVYLSYKYKFVFVSFKDVSIFFFSNLCILSRSFIFLNVYFEDMSKVPASKQYYCMYLEKQSKDISREVKKTENALKKKNRPN